MLKVLHITNTYPHFKLSGDNEKKLVPEGFYVHSQIKSLDTSAINQVYFINGYYDKLNYFRAVFFVLMLNFSNKRKYDVIHAHYGISGFIARLQIRYKLVISFCGSDVLGTPTMSGSSSIIGKLVVLMSKVAHRFSNCSIAKTKEMATILRGVPCKVVPNGVDFQKFKPISKQMARSKLGLKTKKKIILFLGNKESIRKRYDLAESALKHLNRDSPKAILIAGYGSQHSTIPYLMNASDSLLVTSDWEGSINVVKEAMACNLPIVSVDVGDVREVIGETAGCYVCQRDVSDISQKLGYSINFGKTKGRENISHLNSKVISEKILEIYKKAITC